MPRPRSLLCAVALLCGLAVAPGAAPPAGRCDRHGDPLPAGAVERLGSLRFRLPYGLWPAKLTHDGHRVLLRPDIGTSPPGILDLATGKTRRIKLDYLEDDKPTHFTFHPAGDCVLARSEAGSLFLFDLATGKKRWSDTGSNQGHGFDPNGSHFARVVPDGEGNSNVHIHRTDTGKRTALVAVKGDNFGFALAPGGTKLLTWDAPSKDDPKPHGPWQALLIDTASNKELGKASLSEFVLSAVFRPDNKEVAVQTYLSVVILDAATAGKKRTLRISGKRSESWFVSYSPDGKQFAAVGDLRADLWDTKTWKRTPTKPLPKMVETAALGFPGPGKLTVVSASDRDLLITDALTGEVTRSPGGHRGAVAAIFFEGDAILTAGSDGRVLTWDRRGKMRGEFAMWEPDSGFEPRWLSEPLPRGLSAVGNNRPHQFSPSGRWIAGSRGFDRFVYDCKARDMRFEDRTGPITRESGVMIVPERVDEREVVSAVRVADGAELWSATTDGGCEGLAVSPDGKTVAVCQTRGKDVTLLLVRLLDGRTGKPLPDAKVCDMAAESCHQLEFSADGRKLFATDGESLFVIDARSGEMIHTAHLDGQITLMVPDPVGRTVAVALMKDEEATVSTVHVIELASCKPRLTFEPGDIVHSLARSPDGKLLASGHDNGTSLLWDLAPRGRPGKGDAWSRLAGEDAADAFRAMAELGADPVAVALVRKNVRAAPRPEAGEVKKLLALLDDEESPVRDRAQRALRAYGRAVEAELRAALERKPSPEVSRRLKRLIEALSYQYRPELIAPLRAVELLEMVGTTEAKEELTRLSRGEPTSVLTQEAKAALARLAKASKGK